MLSTKATTQEEFDDNLDKTVYLAVNPVVHGYLLTVISLAIATVTSSTFFTWVTIVLSLISLRNSAKYYLTMSRLKRVRKAIIENEKKLSRGSLSA